MSRSYRVNVPLAVLIPASSLSKGWNFTISFSILDILPRKQMTKLLEEELKNSGFKEEDGELVTSLGNNSNVKFNLDTVSATVSIPAPYSNVTVSIEEEVLAQFKRKLKKALENNELLGDIAVDRTKKRIQNDAERQMEKAVIECKNLVNSALKVVYKEAIKTKASKIANVTNISETSENGTYKIRVEMEG